MHYVRVGIEFHIEEWIEGTRSDGGCRRISVKGTGQAEIVARIRAGSGMLAVLAPRERTK